MTLSFCAFASGDTAIMKHFNIENGLPSNNVYAVTQDNLGYIWFNTDNGIVKYNGYTFKLFTISDGLPSNDVWKLFPDKRGRLWVHTHSYKIGYIKNDKYVNLITSTNKIIHPIQINCDSINVYFFYKDHGLTNLVVVDSNDKLSISAIDTPGAKTNMCTISRDNKSILLLANTDNKIFTRSLLKKNAPYDSIKMNFPLKLFTLNGGSMDYYNGRILNTGVFQDYMLLIDSNSKTFKKIYFKDFGGEKNERIYTSVVLGDSLIILTSKAIYHLDLFLKSSRRTKIADIIPNVPQVTFYYVDSFKNEWYTTNNDGVWCKSEVVGLFHPNYNLSPLFSTKCLGILNNGKSFWFDKKRNIIYELKGAKSITKINMPPDDIPIKICNRNDSEAYICSYKNIYVYNFLKRDYKNIAEYFLLDTVRRYNQILEPPMITDPTLVNAAFADINTLFQIKSNKWISYMNPSLVVTEVHNRTAKIRTLDEDRYNNAWFDSTDNLYLFSNINKVSIYNPTTDRYYIIDNKVLKNLGVNTILGIVSDCYSNIYLLDNDKVIVFNLKRGTVKYFRCNFTLADAFITVHERALVIAGKFGVALAKINGPISIEKFRVAVNMNNYNRIYDFMASNTGRIYITTDKGLCDFEVSDLLNNNMLIDPSSPNFFKLIISYPNEKNIIGGDTIRVSQKVSKINLDVINPLGNGNVQYLYFVEGVGGYQQTATGEIFVGNLSANRFYRIQCYVKDNTWTSRRFVFYIYKPPYWWQTTQWTIIFWLLSFILFIGFILIIILLTRYIVARSNEKKRVLTELELKAVYAQINPHFIFNTLSAALYFINRKRFDDAYVHVNKFSKLIRGYLKSSQDRYTTLSEEIEMLKNYIELQKTRFEGRFEYKLEVDNKLPTQNIKIPSLLLQPLVENAINHGLFHKKEDGELLIIFEQGEKNDELICIIEDNGVGREKSKEIKRKSAIERESYGTKLTKQLIDVFKEFENMDISLEYIDKQLPETGTIVKLTIKNIKYVA